MLIVAPQCHEYFDQVCAFADSKGIRADLDKVLARLNLYSTTWKDPLATQCVVFKDFAPNSFSFTMAKRAIGGEYNYWFNGVITFHPGAGKQDLTLAVSLVRPEDDLPRWEVHT